MCSLYLVYLKKIVRSYLEQRVQHHESLCEPSLTAWGLTDTQLVWKYSLREAGPAWWGGCPETWARDALGFAELGHGYSIKR